MKQDNSITLPTHIVIREEQEQVERDLNRAIGRVRTAYTVLSGIADLGNLPAIKCITPDWLFGLIHSHINAVEADNGLIANRKEERIVEWQSVQKKACIHVNVIHGFFSEYPTANLVFDEAIANYVCSNKAEIVLERGNHEVPTDAQEHYHLFLSVENAINTLRQWERSKNLRKIPLDEVLRREHSPEVFARKWIDGMFVKNDFELRPENEQIRQIYEANYL